MVATLRSFLWFCAGANIPILERCGTEYTKYAGIGATVFLTAILASLSGGYAFFTVFNSYALAVPLAIVWGMLIFNLDRFIVSSMRKEANIAKEFSIALPRLVIAFIISIVIVVPIELKLFKKELNRHLLEGERIAIETRSGELLAEAALEIQDLRAALASVEDRKRQVFHDWEAQIDDEEKDIQRIQKEIDAKTAHRTSVLAEMLDLEVTKEREELGLEPSKLRGCGPICKSRLAEIESKRKFISELDRQIRDPQATQARLRERISELLAQRVREIQSLNARLQEIADSIQSKEAKREALEEGREETLRNVGDAVEESTSFLKRMNALGTLTRENPTMDWVVTFIRLLVIVLEISPIVVKLLSSRGPYDTQLEAVEKKAMVTDEMEVFKAENDFAALRTRIQRTREETMAGAMKVGGEEFHRPDVGLDVTRAGQA